MEEYFIKGAQLFLSLSILIVLHEFGHFLPARWFGIRVEKFFLFFDVKFALFKKKIGDTVYGIGWLPLGGYVKIAGMIDESMDKEQMAKEPQSWEFRTKPAWQRLIVMVGGVTVNVILALIIYILILAFYGQGYFTPDDLKYGMGVSKTMETYGFKQGDKVLSINGESFFDQEEIGTYLMVRDVQKIEVLHENGVKEVLELPEDIGKQLFESGDYPGITTNRFPVVLDSIDDEKGGARAAGLLVTDEIKSIDAYEINYRSDISYALKNAKDTVVNVSILRNGQILQKKVNIGEKRILGVYFKAKHIDDLPNPRKLTYSFGESISEGVKYGYWKLHDYVAQFKYVFTKKGATQVGGFGAIAGLFQPTWNWIEFWHTTAFISIILAFMNILPIPALDGGHVMFLLYEMVTGREPNQKFLEYAQMVGFFLLLALVLFANGNDIYRAIFG